MNTVNLDLQLFDTFITESENHLNMIQDHYSKLSKGYLTESAEYQLIQESQESTFKEKIKKIIEAIKKWLSGIVEKLSQKFKKTKTKTDTAITTLKNAKTDSGHEFTHSKFDLSKFDNIKIVNIVYSFLEKMIKMVESTNTDSLDHKIIVELSTNCHKDIIQSIGGGHDLYLNKRHTVSLFLDTENKVTKSYTKDDILTLLEKCKKIHGPLNDISEDLESIYNKFLTIINKKIESHPVTSGTSIYQFILTQTSHTMSIAYRVADDILDAYIVCDNEIFNMSNKIAIKDNVKHESFSPPIDASFNALLEQINPTRIRVLDLD